MATRVTTLSALRLALIACSIPLAMICAGMLFSACRGAGATLDPPPDGTGTPDAGQEVVGQAKLPPLGELALPPRSGSLLGPGWTPLAPLDPSHMLNTSGCTAIPGGQLLATGAGATAFAIYAVQGFDGDCFPTSIRTTLSAVSGEYYVAFSDYVRGAWRPAGPFTDSAEIEIPGLDAYSAPTAFTSAQHVFYFALIVPDLSSITIQRLEVGTHGGSLGPEPPGRLFGSGGATGLLLNWRHSSDYHAPDFAGYRVERAPLLFGNFALLNTLLVRDPYFLDTTAAEGVQYRYRVAALDTAGNRSLWAQGNLLCPAGGQADPVPVVHMPDGPLYAPVDVKFDLSSSFDPEGEALTGFDIEFARGPATISGPGPVFTATLQPGCYFISFTAHTATRQGSTTRTLKVYPRWKGSDVLVRDPDHVGWRKLMRARGWGSPAEGFTMFGQDGSYPSLSAWHFRNVGDVSLATVPCYETYVDWIGDPLQVGNSVLVPVALPAMFEIASFSGNQQQLQFLLEREADPPIALAPDPEDGIYAILSTKSGVQTDLTITKLGPGGSENTVVPNIGALSSLDAVYTASAAAIDIVYADVVSTQWVRWDPVANAIIDSQALGGAMSTWIDLELCPSTGLPSVVYGHTGRNRFRELDNAGNWSGELLIDNAINNHTPFDLAYAPDGVTPECFFSTSVPESNLYEYSGGIWSKRNTVGYAADSGYTVALMAGGTGREMYVADGLQNDDLVLARLNTDGSDAALWTLPVTDGQGHELHAAAALDGLHVGWRSYYSGTGRHFMSNDGGLSWNDMGDSAAAISSIDLAATSDGALYVSYSDGVNSKLEYWDGANFQLRMSFPGLAIYRPFFMSDCGTTIQWFAYEPGLFTQHHVVGDEIGGYADTATVLNVKPVWNGVASSSLLYSFIFAVAGNAVQDESPLGTYMFDQPDFTPLLDPLLGDPLDFLNSPMTKGRNLGATTYLDAAGNYGVQVYYAANGTAYKPIRWEVPFLSSPVLTELPMQADPTVMDGRRTVSTCMAYGVTAVTLLASIDGKDAYFEWSNYGEWEKLPLPPNMRKMGGPELLIGRDGRWHIIYKNYETDQIFCRSTL